MMERLIEKKVNDNNIIKYNITKPLWSSVI